MSKSLAVTASTRRAPYLALAMALSVATVAFAPDHAFAGGKSNGAASNGNSGGNGNSNGNGNGNSGGVSPVSLPVCTLADLSTAASACSGFYEGNLLNNSATDLSAQAAGLGLIGLSNWTGSLAEPQINLTTSLVNFQTALNGMTWIGIHFGAGTNSPSPHTPGGVTAFYRFDAGTNLDAFTLNFGSASAARLYATGPAPAPPPVDPPVVVPPAPPPPPTGGGITPGDLRAGVPEPAAWGLMILGFGAAGAMLRRRRLATAAV